MNDSTMKSLVGYAVWKLERDVPVPQLLEEMRANHNFTGVGEEDIQQAIKLALAGFHLHTLVDAAIGQSTPEELEPCNRKASKCERLSLQDLLSQSTRQSASE